MREIKFRAWDVDEKRLTPAFGLTDCHGYTGDCNNHNCGYDLPDGDNIDLDSLSKGKFIIEQFTGLHDKNGKEIYEGDIDKKYGVFFYQDGCIGLKCGGDFFSMSELCTMPFYLEIIGNIHENPELLS